MQTEIGDPLRRSARTVITDLRELAKQVVDRLHDRHYQIAHELRFD